MYLDIMCSLSSLVAVYTLPSPSVAMPVGFPSPSGGVLLNPMVRTFWPWMLSILCIEKRSVQLQTVFRVTDCNVQQREFCSISDPHCSAQLSGRVVNKDMHAISVLLTRTVNWWWPLNWWWGWRRAHSWRGSGWHIEAGEKKKNNSSTIIIM